VNHALKRSDFYESLTENVAWALAQKFQVDCESKVQAIQILVGAAREVVAIVQKPRLTESEGDPDRATALLRNDVVIFLDEHKDLDVDCLRHLVDAAAEAIEIVQQHEARNVAIYQAYGAVEGILCSLDDALFVNDAVTLQPVDLLFDPSLGLIVDARNLIGDLVYVYGIISSLEDGTKISVDVAEIERLPSEEELPSLDSLLVKINGGDA
jgi:hypothetical protein